MKETVTYQLLGAIIFGAIMETVWRSAPSVTVFVGMAILAQIYIHTFPKTIKIIKKSSKFAKEMQMFKK